MTVIVTSQLLILGALDERVLRKLVSSFSTAPYDLFLVSGDAKYVLKLVELIAFITWRAKRNLFQGSSLGMVVNIKLTETPAWQLYESQMFFEKLNSMKM